MLGVNSAVQSARIVSTTQKGVQSVNYGATELSASTTTGTQSNLVQQGVTCVTRQVTTGRTRVVTKVSALCAIVVCTTWMGFVPRVVLTHGS